MDWTNAGNGVTQLLELIDDFNARGRYDFDGPHSLRSRFEVDRISIDSPKKPYEAGMIRAYDKSNKCFIYAIFVTHDGQLIADGA